MRGETLVSSVFRDLLLLPLFSSKNPIEKLSDCDYSYCMAANLQRRGIASFGKRFVERSWVGSFRDPAAVKISAFRS
ncbi:uncharacterized protein LOC131233364 isoform X2 [Magnolia sinica]|uniref:uncharacterized protein LOC131233364 isoform X2 n=1 Tax=Magnolia sinica TaxID=86752 RepID=UPI0026597676|nr:uncharacterized protein LOC131233364 isoform X2 [Magnolia sinica]